MKKARSYRKLSKRAKAFLELNTSSDFSTLLQISPQKLAMIALRPEYFLFSVKKKDGSPRWIEAPAKNLKKIQRSINEYLQSVYFFHRTDAAYGFLINSKKDPSPRNILTNARRHLGCKWLYNADIKDFFHAIKAEDVFRLFSSTPFSFDDELADLLTRLMTHNGRLPMGTPTSPSISNWICISLDKDLMDLSKRHECIYTRYADDMSFSSNKEITNTFTQQINKFCNAYSFQFNSNKIWLYSPKDKKEITGLIVKEKSIELKDSFIKELENDIKKLEDIHVLTLQFKGQNSQWVDRYKQQIEGKLNFVAQIKGDRHIVPQQLYRKYDHAQNPDIEFLAYSWEDFPYF